MGVKGLNVYSFDHFLKAYKLTLQTKSKKQLSSLGLVNYSYLRRWITSFKWQIISYISWNSQHTEVLVDYVLEVIVKE